MTEIMFKKIVQDNAFECLCYMKNVKHYSKIKDISEGNERITLKKLEGGENCHKNNVI